MSVNSALYLPVGNSALSRNSALFRNSALSSHYFKGSIKAPKRGKCTIKNSALFW